MKKLLTLVTLGALAVSMGIEARNCGRCHTPRVSTCAPCPQKCPKICRTERTCSVNVGECPDVRCVKYVPQYRNCEVVKHVDTVTNVSFEHIPCEAPWTVESTGMIDGNLVHKESVSK